MGHIRHHAIVVEGGKGPGYTTIFEARKAARRIFSDPRRVSAVLGAFVNGSCSFFVAPDGSKEGWDTSNAADAERDAFIAWLSAPKRRDYFAWVEVQFGDDNGVTKIVRADNVRGKKKKKTKRA